jgi:hypothetical protein
MKSPLPAAGMFAALSAISALAENLVRNGDFESGENEFGPLAYAQQTKVIMT